MRAIIVTAIVLWLSLGCGFAHGFDRLEDDISWTFDPWIIVPLCGVGITYVTGALALAGRSRRHRVCLWQAACYGGGWLSLTASLVSPLHWLGEHLFTFHMIEHEIIMAISAPLLVLANPIGPMMWSLPHRARANVGRLMRGPNVAAIWKWLSDGGHATVLHGIAIWAWHAPVLFDSAVTNVAVHRLQHLSFFLTAVLFWWSVFRRSAAGAAAWHVFITMLHTSALGALMTLAPRVLYSAQTATSASWGLTPLEDQQLAGIIMWIPAGTIYAGAALALAGVWIRQAGQRARDDDVAKAV